MSAPAPVVLAPKAAPAHRPIRSFVVRAGRMSESQTEAIDEFFPRFGLKFSPRVFNVYEAFGNRNPLTVEIGFGMGVTTAQMAAAQPARNFLGLEVHPPGVGNLLKLIEAQGLQNLRIIQHDAVEVLATMFAPQSIDAFHIYFPDPWPKKRHHKRRLIQTEFVALLASRLNSGGYVHCATDWEAYAHWMLEQLSAEPLLRNAHAAFAPKPHWRPTTKFETRGLNLGHGVWDLLFTRVAP